MPPAKKSKKVLTSEKLVKLQNFVDQVKTDNVMPFEQRTERANENLKKAGLIKPILYHSFEEKEALEIELFSKIPPEEVKRKSEALMNIFYEAGKKKRNETKKP